MRSRLVVFGAAASLALYVNITARSQSTPPGRPVILGSFVQGKYSNEVLRIALELPPSWQIANLAESEEFSRRLPRRMNLWFRSDDDSQLVAASPVEPDEKLDEVYKVSLLGVQDGGRFHTTGGQVRNKIDGCEVLFQRIRRRSEQGDQFGVYRGFFSRGYYVSILHFGPKRTEETREATVRSLRIQSANEDRPEPGGAAGST
jgi:hypothetical protein